MVRTGVSVSVQLGEKTKEKKKIKIIIINYYVNENGFTTDDQSTDLHNR